MYSQLLNFIQKLFHSKSSFLKLLYSSKLYYLLQINKITIIYLLYIKKQRIKINVKQSLQTHEKTKDNYYSKLNGDS